MNTLEEFDQKLTKATSHLADLVDNTKQVRTVNDLLESTDQHWKNSLNQLSELIQNIQDIGQNLNSANEELALGREALEKTDSSEIIKRLDSQTYDLDKKLSTIQTGIANLQVLSEKQITENQKQNSINQKKINDALSTIKNISFVLLVGVAVLVILVV